MNTTAIEEPIQSPRVFASKEDLCGRLERLVKKVKAYKKATTTLITISPRQGRKLSKSLKRSSTRSTRVYESAS